MRRLEARWYGSSPGWLSFLGSQKPPGIFVGAGGRMSYTSIRITTGPAICKSRATTTASKGFRARS
jgi:hypothetical protein